MSGEGSDPVRPFLDAVGLPGAPTRPGGGPSGVRPYLLTGGRSRPNRADIEIEAQVMATNTGLAALPLLRFEQHRIVSTCQTPLSLAEVAAHAGLHLGVVRVLVGDLVAAGHLITRRPQPGTDRDLDIIERVIHGLQAIA